MSDYRVDRGVRRNFDETVGGSGFDSAFSRLEHKFEREGKSDPGGLAYSIGEKKYGKKGMEEKAEAGRKDK